jgi:PHD/YefM family antitoxin component YafN of YafNO toxin-antitoxin module
MYHRVIEKQERVEIMEMLSVREFRNSPRQVWKKLSESGPLVVTNNGNPRALMLEITASNLEETLDAIRSMQALQVIARMQTISSENGNGKMTIAEVDAEIAAARKERKHARRGH